MQQAVLTDYLRAGIAEDCEFPLRSLLPNFMSMLLIVNANGNETDAQLFQLFAVPRELAQFGHAVRSPISPVKVQKHSVATLIRQSELFAILVFEGEVRRDLAGGRRCLRFGIRFALPECQRRDNEKEEENPTFHEGKIHDETSGLQWRPG